MVNHICGLPEPPDVSEDSISTNQNHEIFVDTDTDEEFEYANYQPLPLSGEDFVSDEEDSDSEAEESPVNEQSIVTAESALVAEVWSAPPPKDIEMDSSKIDEVKEAMLTVTLPPSSFPEWAQNIPEDVWKDRLMQRIQENRQ